MNITHVFLDFNAETEFEPVIKQLQNEDIIIFLIHCAAITEPFTSLTTISRPNLQIIKNINLLTPIFLTQKLTPYFLNNTRVLFLGSDYVGVDKKLSPFISGAYVISKSALRVAVEYLRKATNNYVVGYLNPGGKYTYITTFS